MSDTTRAALLRSLASMRHSNTALLAGGVLAVSMSACGGGSGSGTDVSAGTPATASDSVVISEFLASNETSQADSDGDRSDWIEIHNRGADSVDLTGWALTDDPDDYSQWIFPSYTLAPGGFMTVFASGKDRRNATSQLHTNFKLSSDGEFLALIRPDNVAATSFSPAFPSQSSDISYGFYAETQLGYLSYPTPGQANSPAALAAVVPSREGGLFTGSFALRLDQQQGRSATIHFTLDGSEPDAQSSTYTGPIQISSSALIRARAIDGTEMGREWSATYTAIDAGLISFESNMPVVIVDTGNAQILDEADILATVNVVEPAGSTTRLAAAVNGTDRGDSGTAAIQIRGRSSALFPKKQFKLELKDADGSNRSANLLKMGSENDWILYAPGRYDRNYIANPLIQGLAGKVGLDEMKMRFVELYVNEDGGPVSPANYRGIYALAEKIKIDEERIDIRELSASDVTEPDVTGGYILSIDRDLALAPDPDLYWFTTSAGNARGIEGMELNVERPKRKDLKPEQSAWITDYMNRFEAAVYSPDAGDEATGFRAYIDTKSWIDTHLLTLFAQEVDFLYFSHYMYIDRGGKLISGPLWDFDRSLNSDDPRDDNPQTLFQGRPVPLPFYYRWWDGLFNDPGFATQYRARWNELRATTLSTPSLFADIDALAAQIAPAYSREMSRWGATAGYGSRYGDFAGEIDALKQWVTLRVNYLDLRLNQALKQGAE